MSVLHSTVVRCVDGLKVLGGASLAGMMLVTVADVIFRYFGHPIFGAVEVVSLLAIITLGCAMPVTHMEKGHVGVDLFTRRLSTPLLKTLDTVTGLLSAGLFGLTSWQLAEYSAMMRASGEVSMSLEFPVYILVYVLAAGFTVLTAIALIGVLEIWQRGGKS